MTSTGRPDPDDWAPNRPPKPDDKQSIDRVYHRLRHACAALEEVIEDRADLTEKQRKRLDKAVTVMKVGFKIVKKAMGKAEIKPWRDRPPVGERLDA